MLCNTLVVYKEHLTRSLSFLGMHTFHNYFTVRTLKPWTLDILGTFFLHDYGIKVLLTTYSVSSFKVPKHYILLSKGQSHILWSLKNVQTNIKCSEFQCLHSKPTAIENTVTYTIKVTYTQHMIGRLDAHVITLNIHHVSHILISCICYGMV